jgi:hypothetical protein
MENRHQIVSELRDIGPFLAEMEAINPFSVPKGYFDSLPQVIIESIRDKDKVFSGLENKNAYPVPINYFEQLSENILSAIKQTKTDENEIRKELEEIAPLLNTIPKEPVYQVPTDYFIRTHFNASMIKEMGYAKIVPLSLAKKWTQYAAAAVVAGILVTGAFLFTDNKNYREFENIHQIDFSSELSKVKDEELVTYLNSPEHLHNLIPETTFSVGEDVVDIENTSIQLFTDDELAHYLSENTESRKISALPKNNLK